MRKPIILSVLSTVLAVSGAASAQTATPEAAFKEMKQILGLVPTFMSTMPAEAVPGVWDELKGVELNPTSAIPNQYKELIGLGVAAQIPCRYCTYFHTKVAKLVGASDRQVAEAVIVASITRQWSTVLNGNQIDEEEFKREVQQVLDYVVKPHPGLTPVDVVDAASAYKDMQQTLGLVPPFLKAFPEAGVAGAWREFKSVDLNPSTSIPNKYKELIGLGVASQIPCRYCIIHHTALAKLFGASDAEIREAIAVAALTRHMSTFLNGMMLDEQQFRSETDQIVAYVGSRKH
jgi:AhpD family alkylhydroperoxidase